MLLHIELRLVNERADSINAISLSGFLESRPCRSGSVCRITSVTKCKSDAEFTLGMTRASIFGALSYNKVSESRAFRHVLFHK